jgi:SynChlorMet cassette radical SAM/SPASM protein ScmE
MLSPRSVEISITSHCNLSCRYCFHYTSASDTGKDLPTEEWLRFFEELNRLAVMDVTLGGGEPLMYQDFSGIVAGITANRMRFSILSNGTLIDEEMAALLAETGRCNYVQVSLDAGLADVHDVCRGRGSFYAAVQGLDNLLKVGVKTTVRVTVNKHNVHHLEETARFLLEEKGLASFSTNSAGYLGLCRENSDIQLNNAERVVAMETLVRLSDKYHNRINAAAGPLAEARMWAKMEEARQTGAEQFRRGGALTACGCVLNKLAVRSDGVIVPCTQLSQVELGRINKDSLADIWQDHPEIQRLRQRHTIALDNFAECCSCPYMPYCTGNCPALAYSLKGDADIPSPDACLKLFLAEGGRLPGKPLS